MVGRPWAIACLVLALLPLEQAAAGSTAASGAGTSLVLNTSVSVDSAHDHDAQLGGWIGLSDTTGMTFLAEYTGSPAGRLDLVTHTYSLGLDQDLGADGGFTLRYERWGKPDDIVSDAWYGSFRWQPGDWRLEVLPGWRKITLYKSIHTTGSLAPLRTIDTSDRPLGVRLGFTGVEDWLFEVSTTRDNYTRNPAFLNSRRALAFFTGSVLTLSQGFLSHAETARVERDWDLLSVATDYEIDRSAINGAYSYTNDLDMTIPLSG